MRSAWTAPTIVFAAAAAVRLLHVWELADSPFATVRMGDGVSYHQWAGRIASGDWFGEGVFYQAPLYPYFLAAIYAALGQSLVVVRICQALVGAVACALLTRAAESEFGRTAGLCAGLLLAFDGDAVFLEGLVQKSVLDSLLVCALVLQLLAVRQQPTWPRALALGSVSALLGLSRENALVWLPVLFLWLATRPSHRRACLAGVAAGAILVLAPVAARNRIAGGNWQLTTAQSGPNLYIGNSPLATGTYVPLRPRRQIPAYEQRDATDLAEQALGRRLSASEVSDYWTSSALRWIREHPAAWLRLIGFKIFLLVNARGASDTEDIATHAQYSRTLQFTRHIVSFGVLVPLAAVALWMLRARLRELWVLPAMLVTYGVSVIAFFVLDRYRFPLVPLLCLLAGASLTAIKPWWSTSKALEKTGAGLFALATAIACYWPIPLVDEAQMRAVTAFNLGVTFQEEGRLDAAEEQYKLAIAIQPDDPAAQSNLGTIFAAKGDHVAALARYQEALRIDPTYPTALNNIATELGAMGRHSDADQVPAPGRGSVPGEQRGPLQLCHGARANWPAPRSVGRVPKGTGVRPRERRRAQQCRLSACDAWTVRGSAIRVPRGASDSTKFCRGSSQSRICDRAVHDHASASTVIIARVEG